MSSRGVALSMLAMALASDTALAAGDFNSLGSTAFSTAITFAGWSTSAYNDFVLENKTNDLSESQPTKGNIAGGLTTIEEKAFGNLHKIGKKTNFIDVLEPAEEPTKGPGLYFMDTSSAAAECVTLQAAAGVWGLLAPGNLHRGRCILR